MEIQFGEIHLKNLSSINVIIGKNGCGKSRLLRLIDENRSGWTHVKYITPERGGKIEYAPDYEGHIQSQDTFDKHRRKNHDEYFRQKSIAQLKNLENLINRQRSDDLLNKTESVPHFNEVLNTVNELLDNIVIEINLAHKLMPDILGKEDRQVRNDAQLSSGEKELVSLASEILYFVYQVNSSLNDPSKKALLLLDEPDVHLHPDLQYRLVELLSRAIKDQPITVIISTHSTAILGALGHSAAHVAFMKKGMSELIFSAIDQEIKGIIPIFGAHPLSNIFSQAPILLVEGGDDERIWQQAVRSSEGRIKLWPCPTDTVDNLNKYERKASDLINAIYDDARGFSIRDRDNEPYEINDLDHIKRARLNCYAVENLILSDDVLNLLEITWKEMQSRILDWIKDKGVGHSAHAKMESFSEKFDRRNHKVQGLENVFIYLTGKNKPWEVAVGQAIAKLDTKSSKEDGSLADFLGPKIVEMLKLCH
jgi:energy-coupling factor transporter ATP-binding protein EcfA2